MMRMTAAVANDDDAAACIDGYGQRAPWLVLMMRMTAAAANDDDAAACIDGCGRWRRARLVSMMRMTAAVAPVVVVAVAAVAVDGCCCCSYCLLLFCKALPLQKVREVNRLHCQSPLLLQMMADSKSCM
jgi:hypothetical protein